MPGERRKPATHYVTGFAEMRKAYAAANPGDTIVVSPDVISAQENQGLTSRPRCTVTPPCGHRWCWYCASWKEENP